MARCQVSHVNEKASLKLNFKGISGKQTVGAGIWWNSQAYPGISKGSVDLHQIGQKMSLFASSEAP